MAKLTLEQLKAVDLSPKTELFNVPVLGGEVEITGVATADELTAIADEAAVLSNVSLSVAGIRLPSGGTSKPNRVTIINAVFVSKCVDPKQSPLGWIEFASSAAGKAALDSMAERCYVMSRMNVDDTENVSGIEQAKEVLKTERPLESVGDPTVVATSKDSPAKCSRPTPA